MRFKFDYRILSAGIQLNQVVVWVLEDLTRQTSEIALLHVLNTGNTLEKIRNLKHIATFTSENGIVWHVFEEVPENKYEREVFDDSH